MGYIPWNNFLGCVTHFMEWLVWFFENDSKSTLTYLIKNQSIGVPKSAPHVLYWISEHVTD